MRQIIEEVQYKYDVFLSYSHHNKSLVKRVQRTLETWMSWKDPAVYRQKLNVFRDESHLTTGSLSQLIQDALGQSRFLIVFCSKEALDSEYVYQELQTFYLKAAAQSQNTEHDVLDHILFAGCEKEEQDNKKIIHELIRHALSGVIEQKELYKILKNAEDKLYADFGSENGRLNRKHERIQSYKLAAAIIGVDLDDLWKRAERRRRTIIGTVLSALVLILFLAYASITNYKATRDRDARRIALVAEAKLSEGDNLLASQLALATTESKWLYQTVVPEAVSVLTDATHIYEVPSDARMEKSGNFSMRYDSHISMDTSQDGRYIAAVNEAGDIAVWDADKKEQIWEYSPSLQTNFNENIRFLEDRRLLVYDYGRIQCFDLESREQIWDRKFDTPIQAVVFDNSSRYDSAARIVYDDTGCEGVVNLAEVNRKGTEVLFSAERRNGLVLRDELTGEILAQLTRENIDLLLPEGISYYRNILYYPVTMLSQMQKSYEIGYDPEQDIFMVPCYSSKTEESGIMETAYPGIVEWHPESGEARYVSLEYSFAENDHDTEGIETILYPYSGLIVKAFYTNERLMLCAFDRADGKELWFCEFPDYEYSADRLDRCIGLLNDCIVLIDGKTVHMINPSDGNAISNIDADLSYGEGLMMFLSEDRLRGNNGAENTLLVTDKGRICLLNNQEIHISEDSLTISEGELSKQDMFRYIPEEASFTGIGLLYSVKSNMIQQYEIGRKNRYYENITTRKADSLSVMGGLQVYSAGSDRLLVNDQDGAWEYYDLSDSSGSPLWSISVDDIEKARNEKFSGNSLEELFKRLTFIGIDPADGSLLLYEQNLYGFVQINPQTGEIIFKFLPVQKNAEAMRTRTEEDIQEQYTGLIKSPVITENGYNYIAVSCWENEVEYSLFRYDSAQDRYQEFFISELVHVNVEVTDIADQSYRLIMDPSDEYAVIIGLAEGPWLINLENGTRTPLNADKELLFGPKNEIGLDQLYGNDDQSRYDNVFFTGDRREAVSVFDGSGNCFAINYPAQNKIIICDTSGKEISSRSYFNTLVTDMLFLEKSFLVFTADGRVMSFRQRDMKLQKTVLLSEEGNSLSVVGKDRSLLWVKNSANTVFCIEHDSLLCQQKIRNAAAVDIKNRQIYLYRKNNEKITIGRVPVFSEGEILDEAMNYVNNRKMREEEIVYYGLD